jgi:arylsulfatase
MDLITGKGPSARHEIFYFTEGTLSAVRLDDFKYRFTDQPGGWLGGTVKVDWPILTNIRLDPFERTGLPNGDKGSFVSADAEGRELQPRSRQGADREGHAVARWQVECAVSGRSALGRPFSRPVLGNVSSCQVSDMVGLADDVRLRG